MHRPILPPRWRELQPLLDAALDLPAEQRGAFCDAACAGDASLRDELHRLLAIGARVELLIDRPVLDRFGSLISAEMSLPPASIVGAFRIEHELGRGGMATVYGARDEKHGRNVALKVLRPELAAWIGPELFLAEIRMTAKLQHPHILALFDSGESDGILYYVMPRVDGENLRQRLAREGALPIADAVRILRDVADALAYAHRHDVVHCDIKPENVMLSGRHAFVADFGIARAVLEAHAQQSSLWPTLGTPSYMAPESIANDSRCDHRVDLYAFGVLAFELLTGRLPNTGTSGDETPAQPALEPPDSPTRHRDGIPPSLAALVVKCLEPNPENRWQRAGELVPALEALLSATDEAAMRVPLRAGARRPFGGQRPVRIAGVVGIAVFLIAAAWFGALRPPPLDPTLVVVAPFENRTGRTGDASLGDELAERLTEQLSAQGATTPVSSTRVRQLLARARGGTAVSPTFLSSTTGAGILVTGTVYRHGDTLEYRAEVLRMPGGALVGAVRPVRSRDAQQGATLLADRLAVLIVAHAEWGDEMKWGIAYDLPDHLAAYRAFSEALTAAAGARDGFVFGSDALPDEAVSLFRRADSLEPSWVTARAFGGDDSVRVKALLQQPGLLPGTHEQLQLVLATTRGRWEEGYQLARRRFGSAPGAYATMLAFLAYITGRYEEVLALGGAHDSSSFWNSPDRASPWYDIYAGYALHALGRYREELERARRWRSRDTRWELMAITDEIMAQSGLGDADAVAGLVAQARALRPEDYGPKISLDRAVIAGKELRAHGRPDAATAIVEQAIGRERRRIASGDSGLSAFESLSELQGVVGDYVGQQQSASELLRRSPPRTRWRRTALERVGFAAAARGDSATARHALRELERSHDESPTLIGVPFQSATILFQLGDTTEAIARLRQAHAQGDAMMWLHVGWHRAPLFVESLLGIPAVRAIMRAKRGGP